MWFFLYVSLLVAILTLFGNDYNEVTLIFPQYVKYFTQCDELGEITISGITEKYSDVQQILSVLASANAFKLFVCAERGFVFSLFLLEKL